MEPGREVEAPAAGDVTPLPMQVDTLAVSAPPAAPHPPADLPADAGGCAPTARTVLLAVVAANGPWFPARFAAEAGIPRDSLDEPLAELRVAGLVRVAEWERGVGQGYAATPEGEVAAAADPVALERLVQKAADPATAGSAPRIDATDPGAGATESDLDLTPPIVVPALLIANALWFFICAVWSIRWGLTPARALSESHPEVLHRFGAVSGVDLLDGEWWRLLTSCFVHIGVLHLVGNMFALAMMGPLAELLWGRGRLLLIYLVSGLAGSALAMALRPDTVLAGASGAIWGIQMSLFAWLFAFRRRLPADLAADWLGRLTVVFALNAGLSLLPGVSWEGHLGGGLAGFVAAGLLNAARFGDRPRRVTAWVLLALLPALSVAGVAAAMGAHGMPGWQHLYQRLAGEREARDELGRKQRQRDAVAEFADKVVPRMPGLAPEVVKPVEMEAGLLLVREKRPEAKAAELRKRATAIKDAADAVVEHATRDPVGMEGFDRQRERTRAFAAARARAMGLLVGMLDTNTSPRPEAWAAWQAARRDADLLWAELAVK